MSRTRQDTRTIQLWPGGQSVTFRGDVDGPVGRRSLREASELTRCNAPAVCYSENGYRVCMAHVTGETPHAYAPGESGRCDARIVPRWRKGTAEEWAAIRAEVRAEQWQRQEVYCCDSGLVDALVKCANGNRAPSGDDGDLREAFEYEQIRNLYADPSDWTGDQCLRYLYDQTGERNYRDRADRGWDVEVRAFALHEGYAEGSEEYDQYIDEQTEELRQGVREYSQDHPAEVYEWWRVSQWLCDQLHAIGEVTIDNGLGCWWGRTTTGQGMLMDGVLQRVARRFESEVERVARAERLVVKP